MKQLKPQTRSPTFRDIYGIVRIYSSGKEMTWKAQNRPQNDHWRLLHHKRTYIGFKMAIIWVRLWMVRMVHFRMVFKKGTIVPWTTFNHPKSECVWNSRSHCIFKPHCTDLHVHQFTRIAVFQCSTLTRLHKLICAFSVQFLMSPVLKFQLKNQTGIQTVGLITRAGQWSCGSL